MNLPGHSLLVLCAVVLGAMAAQEAAAQAAAEDQWNKIDLKPLIPPIVPLPPLPPNSQLAPGGLGGTASPFSSAPPTISSQAPSSGAGITLTIPSR